MPINVRFQIAAICFFTVILYDYIKNKKLPILSTRFFSIMLIFTGIYLSFDVATVYSITHMDTFPAFLNRIFHQCFILSLLFVIISLYWYVELLGNHQKRTGRVKLVLTMLPAIIMVFVTLFGDLNYYVEDNVVYSYGTMVIYFYFCIAYYIMVILVNTFIYKEHISIAKRRSIRIGLVIWICIALMQFFNPELLLSGMGVVLMILFIYLSFENQKEHIDNDIGIFNKRAIHLVLAEKKESKKNVYIVDIVIEDLYRIQNMIGHSNTHKLLRILGDKIHSVFQVDVYHARSNVLSVVLDSSTDSLPIKIEQMEIVLNKPVTIGQFSVVMLWHIDILNTEFCAENSDDLFEMMNYMASKRRTISDKLVHVLDEHIINEKRRYQMIENLLQYAIHTDGFQVVYQPIYDVKSG